jgi:DNA-binding PadR family transcriptional regulator
MRLKPSSYLILGMLSQGKKTGYAIKRAVDRSTRFFWAASLAQVYPELSALERDGYVVSAQEPHGARPRKVYRLTNTGRAALGGWLRSECTPEFEFRDEGLLRLFFADAMPLEEASVRSRSSCRRSSCSSASVLRGSSSSMAEVSFEGVGLSLVAPLHAERGHLALGPISVIAMSK